MNKPLKLLIKLIENLTKGNPILKILIYLVLMVWLILILVSIFIHFNK